MSWFTAALVLGLAILIPTAYAAKIGAPYVPARRATVRKGLAAIQAGLGDTLVDLGAGDGSIVLEAANRGIRSIGFELSPLMLLIAKLRIFWWRLKNSKKDPKPSVRWRNFYKQDLGGATIVYAFLLPQNMERLKKYLAAQNMPQSKYMLVYAFPFQETPPLDVIREPKTLPLYIYDLRELTRRE